MIFKDKNKTTYNGQWKNGKKDGFGISKGEMGTYEGLF
jgi:hypothetical protein